MSKRIEYENKIALQNNESIPERNKVTDMNMNEIKNVVNSHATEIEKVSDIDTNIEEYLERQDILEQKYDEQIKELANQNPQLPEIVDARQGYDTLGEAIKQKIYYFNTVADMKANTELKAGDTCQTLGYHEVNDGGAGLYQVIAAPLASVDEGSYIAISNNYIAKLIINDSVNVRQFGAYGDNIHDDTQSIVKALSLDGDIYFPKGTYLVSEELEINTRAIKSVTLAQNATIKANAVFDSILRLKEDNSNNFICSGGTLDCNSLAQRGIYSDVILYSPTFKQMLIKNATEVGLELTYDASVSCHGFISDVKIYNPETLATGMIFEVHDMQIDDCEIFYTNLGIDFKKQMHTVNNVHIWAGGASNTNANTVGIKYVGGEVLNLDSIYFDGMNTCIDAEQGYVNMQNMIFYYPDEGTYDEPVCLYGTLYVTHWNLGVYYLKSVVPVALMDYKTFDADNIVTTAKSISAYSSNQNQLFNSGLIDMGYNNYFMIQKETRVMGAYQSEYKNNVYYLFGYYVLPANQKNCSIDLALENAELNINQEIHCNFTYSGGINGTVTINKERNNIKNNGRNTNVSILLGKPKVIQTIKGHSISTIPIYFKYLTTTTSHISKRDLIVKSISNQSPGGLVLFNSVEKNDVQSSDVLTEFRGDCYYNGVLNSGDSFKSHLTKMNNYKLIIINFGNGQVTTRHAEYIISASKLNIETIQTGYSSDFTLPTISVDNSDLSITITAPSGQWYFIELQEM